MLTEMREQRGKWILFLFQKSFCPLLLTRRGEPISPIYWLALVNVYYAFWKNNLYYPIYYTFFLSHCSLYIWEVTYMFARHTSNNATWFGTPPAGSRNSICFVQVYQQFYNRFALNITHLPFRIIPFT